MTDRAITRRISATGGGSPSIAEATFVLYVIWSAILGASAIFAGDDMGATPLIFAFAVLAIAVGTAALAAGERFTPRWAVLLLICDVLCVGVLCATTNSEFNLVANSSLYVVMGLYTVWFFPVRRARLFLLLGVGSYLAIVIGRGFDEVVPFAAVVSAQALLAAEVTYRARDRMHHLMVTDPLTGVLNRRAIPESLLRAMQRFDTERSVFSIVSIDIDDFKRLNDVAGHEAGDEALRLLTQRWQTQLRNVDVLARVGGDEFMILLPECSQNDPRVLVERLRDHTLPSWSAGVACVQPSDALATMTARADGDLYEQKVRRREQSTV